MQREIQLMKLFTRRCTVKKMKALQNTVPVDARLTGQCVALNIIAATIALALVMLVLAACGIGGGGVPSQKTCLQCPGSGQALIDCQLQQPPGCPN
jgi:hypothetical protein